MPSCPHCQSAFTITPDDLAFYEKVSPVIGGTNYAIPPPTLCPDCRQQRRLAFRNERHLYKSTCAFSGKTIVSAYSPDKPYKVYDNEIWWSDKWDGTEYGRAFDSDRSVFDQMQDLLKEVPLINLLNTTSENSEYTLNATYNKDCYMLFCGSFNEGCIHCYWIQNSVACVDCIGLRKSERCYECLDCLRCYELLHSQDCTNCTSSMFLWDCVGCANCVGCTNLRNKSYYWLNQRLMKEEFEQRLTGLLQSPAAMSELRKSFTDLKSKAIHSWSNQRMSEHCTGNYIVESRNCRACFDARQSEDCAYCEHVADMKESRDVSFFGLPGELLYECNNLGVGAYHSLFCSYGYDLKESLYCYNCHFCEHCFGCVNLHHKKYCIFNTQHSRQAYEKIVPTIIDKMRQDGDWGEFFPPHLSPFGYNETVANEYFPLRKEDAKHQGFTWSDYEQPVPHVDRVIPADQLPLSIEQIPDDVTNWAIQCEATKKPFRIVHQELDFYRSMHLPLPHLHSDERHRRRMALRNPRKLWARQCVKCGKEMMTSYSPERSEIVYCEHCYLESVY